MTGVYGNSTSNVGWAMIESMVTGRTVVQLGFGYGHDTARIALHASHVTALGQSPHVGHLGYLSPLDQWADILYVRCVRHKVHHASIGLDHAAWAFTPREFDVAIVDLSALQVHDLHAAIEVAAFLAPVIVVLQPSNWAIAGTVATLLGEHWNCEHQGNMFILRTADALVSAAATGE